MPTLQSDETNILDAETINWRLIVYPLLAALVIAVGGVGYYYYLQNQREQLEITARAALADATTPEELVKVADQYPGADQATLALLTAANMSFTKHDYAAAIQDYQRITQNASTLPELHDAAQIGLASAQEATGKIDDAISTYLSVAQLGTKSPFAPYAYNAAARLYEQQGNKDKEREILTEAASLDPDSPFVKDAQNKLKQMTATAQPPLSVPLPATPAPAAPAPAPNPSTPPASASAPAPVQK